EVGLKRGSFAGGKSRAVAQPAYQNLHVAQGGILAGQGFRRLDQQAIAGSVLAGGAQGGTGLLAGSRPFNDAGLTLFTGLPRGEGRQTPKSDLRRRGAGGDGSRLRRCTLRQIGEGTRQAVRLQEYPVSGVTIVGLHLIKRDELAVEVGQLG